MDTSAEINQELRSATVKRKKQAGHRCLGKQRDGNYALSLGVATGCFTAGQLRKLADIIEKLGTNEFARCRIGIGHCGEHVAYD